MYPPAYHSQRNRTAGARLFNADNSFAGRHLQLAEGHRLIVFAAALEREALP